MTELANQTWIIGGMEMTEEDKGYLEIGLHKERFQAPKILLKDCMAVRSELELLFQEHVTKDEPTLFKLMVSAEEAIMNALHHGNGFDVNKLVRIHLILTHVAEGVRIQLHVEDEGTNLFNPQAEIAEALEPENLERPDGRGCLMISVCARFDIDVTLRGDPPNGKVVKMNKVHLRTEPTQPSKEGAEIAQPDII